MSKQRSKTERFDLAASTLGDRMSSLKELLKAIHPTEGCLPMPSIEVPTTPAELGMYVMTVYENLFRSNGSRAQRWIDARATCSHITEECVLDVNEVCYRWYQLICAAHVESGPEYATFHFRWFVDCYDRAVRQLHQKYDTSK
jgi:hypothetical protein